MTKEKKDAKAVAEPSEKSKNEKFVELAEIRVSKTLRQIAMISNLSDKSKYDYSEKEVQQIYDALQSALDQMKGKFENGEDKALSFKLS